MRAVLEMWYPGQEGGQATADVLLGRAEPGGRLPVSFPPDATQFPTFDPGCTDTSPTGNCPLYPGVVGPSPFLSGATTTFRTITGMAVNGIFEGCRWYDEHDVAPLYPFGHGLSYTEFSYSDLHAAPAPDGGLDVTFRVRNIGDRAGHRCAAGIPGARQRAAIHDAAGAAQARAVRRVSLAPHESTNLTLHVAPRDLSSWSSDQHHWVLGTGPRTVYLGSSSRDLPLRTTAFVHSG